MDCHRNKIPGRSLVEKRTLNIHSTISEFEEHKISRNFTNTSSIQTQHALSYYPLLSTPGHVGFTTVEPELINSTIENSAMVDCDGKDFVNCHRVLGKDSFSPARVDPLTSSVSGESDTSYSVTHRVVPVSYTHLTLPTIYSV